MCIAAVFNVASSCITQQVLLLTPNSSSAAPSIADFLLFRNLPNAFVHFLLSWQLATRPFSLPSSGRLVYLTRLLVPALTSVFMFNALSHLDVSIYTVIFQTSPFFVTLFAYFFLRSPIEKSELAAMVCCFGAVILITLTNTGSSDS